MACQVNQPPKPQAFSLRLWPGLTFGWVSWAGISKIIYLRKLCWPLSWPKLSCHVTNTAKYLLFRLVYTSKWSQIDESCGLSVTQVHWWECADLRWLCFQLRQNIYQCQMGSHFTLLVWSLQFCTFCTTLDFTVLAISRSQFRSFLTGLQSN